MYNLVDELEIKLKYVGVYEEGIKEYRAADGLQILWIDESEEMKCKEYFWVKTRLNEYLDPNGDMYGNSQFMMINPKVINKPNVDSCDEFLTTKEKYHINGIKFEYTQYKDIEREEVVKLSRKASIVKRFSNELYEALFAEMYNQSKSNKHKTPNYYISAIRKRLSEIEEELKKYEK